MVLAPGVAANPLHCSLSTIQINQAPPYEALSYVWGKKTDQTAELIFCDGHPISITPNLGKALRYLRFPNQPRYMWVDALCINQEDAEERGRQVRNMRLVYKHAARVVVWLGFKTPGVELAFGLAQRMAKSGDLPQIGSPDVSVDMTDDDLETAILYLSELFDREYFSRIWCVQEVVSSKICIAKCEDLEMNFIDILSTTPYIIGRRGQIFSGKPLEFWNAIALNNLKRTSFTEVEGSIGSLLTILAGTRDFKATDPRDKLFAIFGISNEGLQPHLARKLMGDQNSFTVRLHRTVSKGIHDFFTSLSDDVESIRPRGLKTDYTKDLMEVYRDFTRFLIRCSPRVLDVLSHVQHTDDPAESLFPSWVPKWFQPRSVSVPSGMFLAGYCKHPSEYYAVVHDMPLLRDAINPNCLQIDGFKVDTVSKVSEVMNFELNGPWPAGKIWSQMFDSPLFPRSSSPLIYRNGDPLDVAFCLTAMASPLGNVVKDAYQAFATSTNLPHPDISQVKRRARADVAAYLVENSGVDTLSSPEYAPLLALAQSSEYSGDTERANHAAKIFSHNRRFYLTQNGYMGIGPQMMRPGDEVCVLYGGRLPFILRPRTGHHIFVGDTYLCDEEIMWGEAAEAVISQKSRIRGMTFKLM
ncbi:hypothetical protein VE03_05679 [Pseudogymnoascus sp. 23342-1-I1]|nr:hypothetical protein VE03_05679 [Pseudogymnoascus sp. 23342-1-I1]